MTASTPRRSWSACQSGTGSAPAYRTARAASVSSSDPGNVTTPIRTSHELTWADGPKSAVGSPLGLGRAAQGRLPPDSLVEHDAGATARRRTQGDPVDAGPHDREP